MNSADFYQAKVTFLMQYPDVDELAFYRDYTNHHPNEAIGWLHLGREWEKRSQNDKALDAYRRAAWCKQSDKYTDEARDAYHRLLRAKKRQSRLASIRRGVAALLFFLTLLSVFVQPNPLADDQQFARQSTDRSDRHTEVIAVPSSMSNSQASKQLLSFLSRRNFTYDKPYTLLVINEVEGLPLFTPLVFYKPGQIRGMLDYNPSLKHFTLEKWYPAPCNCDNDTSLQASRIALAKEQIALAKVLTLRNALFRQYQLAGKLPETLSDLDKPYPQNVLSYIPQHAIQGGERSSKGGDQPTRMTNQEWPYHPTTFDPKDVWGSLRRVIPLLHYPEPLTPLEPLSIYIQQSSYRLTLMSGSHVVRRYSIGIGRDHSTPVGYYRVLQKINNPQGHNHVFGTRGLLFANDYAIHGTNKPDSIGHSESLGCVRLHNQDVEELYSFVSPGTEVIISSQEAPPAIWSNALSFLLPAGADEETPQTVYHWLH
ncbi:L,D-transpeptidase [Brevibacillus ginsengisoli]|uniref:L,D-transpeptidase n=1 Tax=Brevibacillus ginsengisoli TaxID=363854 RepID=UPI003CE87F7F